jgi:hypothetical protein
MNAGFSLRGPLGRQQLKGQEKRGSGEIRGPVFLGRLFQAGPNQRGAPGV